MELESAIQSKIIKRYEYNGWYVVKIIQCNKNGFPDLLLIKGGQVKCIEVKRPDGKLRPLQEYRIKELLNYGCKTEVLTA